MSPGDTHAGLPPMLGLGTGSRPELPFPPFGHGAVTP